MTDELDQTTHSHRRFNPLTRTWVIVSPHRTQRPWSGAVADTAPATIPSHDPNCYLCPGNTRAGGAATNPQYRSTYVFDNDFAALNRAVPPVAKQKSPSLFRVEPAEGECRVICFSPDHRLTLGEMSNDEICAVIDLWKTQTAELEAKYRWVQIFETRGDICGSSNPHPHGQIWASQFLPDEPAKERVSQANYLDTEGSHLLLDYVEQEIELGDRLIAANDRWAVVTPYWAYWPYETLVLPRRHLPSLSDLTNDDRNDLASLLKKMLIAFSQVFNAPFPYCSGWHSGSPQDRDIWQLHGHYYPPLLRSADVAKIPASYEVLAGVQRDFTPEHAAEHLSSLIR